MLYLLKIIKTPKPIIINTFFGSKMKIVIPEVVSSFLYVGNHFEPEVEQALLRYLGTGDVFVDVGAHFGYFSLLAAKLVGNTGRVFAFEPTPSTYKVLGENLENRPICTTINKAVFSKNSSVIFHDFGIELASLNSLYSPRTTMTISGKDIKVDTVSLDSYFYNKSYKLNFVKIDAESAEFEILQGMKKILSRDKPVICIEKTVVPVRGAAPNENLFNFLLSRGYKSYQLINNRFEACDPNAVRQYNILFLPTERYG